MDGSPQLWMLAAYFGAIVALVAAMIGLYTLDEALKWGVTGPGLRACGLNWDLRKKRPYGGYDQFEFDVPTATHGDCYDRVALRVAEMRQSLRIIRQCLENMPEGPYKSSHPLATPPVNDRAMHDIETLITHFLNVGWGPVIPSGEACVAIEATKGINAYYLSAMATRGRTEPASARRPSRICR